MNQGPDSTWLKDRRVLTAIGVATAVGFTAGLLIFGQPWHLPPNYGDVPTWLAAVFAALAGWVALNQLSMLRQQGAEAGRRSAERDRLLQEQVDNQRKATGSNPGLPPPAETAR